MSKLKTCKNKKKSLIFKIAVGFISLFFLLVLIGSCAQDVKDKPVDIEPVVVAKTTLVEQKEVPIETTKPKETVIAFEEVVVISEESSVIINNLTAISNLVVKTDMTDKALIAKNSRDINELVSKDVGLDKQPIEIKLSCGPAAEYGSSYWVTFATTGEKDAEMYETFLQYRKECFNFLT